MHKGSMWALPCDFFSIYPLFCCFTIATLRHNSNVQNCKKKPERPSIELNQHCCTWMIKQFSGLTNA